MAVLPERANAVQYSKPYAPNIILLYGSKSDAIKANEDMRKFSIGVPSSSVQDKEVTAKARKDTKILRFAVDSATISRSFAGTETTRDLRNSMLRTFHSSDLPGTKA